MREWLESGEKREQGQEGFQIALVYPTALENVLVFSFFGREGMKSVFLLRKDSFLPLGKIGGVDAVLANGAEAVKLIADKKVQQGIIEKVRRLTGIREIAKAKTWLIPSPISEFFGSEQWQEARKFFADKLDLNTVDSLVGRLAEEENDLEKRLIVGDGERYVKTVWSRKH